MAVAAGWDGNAPQYPRAGTPEALRARFVPAQSRFVPFSASAAENRLADARFRGGGISARALRPRPAEHASSRCCSGCVCVAACGVRPAPGHELHEYRVASRGLSRQHGHGTYQRQHGGLPVPRTPSSNLVGWQATNPNIQFNFTGGQSVSTARVWVAPTSVGVAVYQPTTLSVSAGTYSKTINVTALTNNSLTVAVDITGISAAADQFSVTSTRGGEWTMFSQVQFFGTGAKANNTTALNLASSWTGNQAPVSTDVVLFNNTFTGTTALDTGTAADWAGMRVTGGSGTLTIDPSTSANRLGIGSSGIELSGTGRSVRLTDLRLTGSTAQPWSIAAGRSLTIGADSLAQNAGAAPVLSGSGTLVKEGASTGLSLGSLTSFTGTLSVQAVNHGRSSRGVRPVRTSIAGGRGRRCRVRRRRLVGGTPGACGPCPRPAACR